jgi:RHS repeat-associated protein
VEAGSSGWHSGGRRIAVCAAALGLLAGLIPAPGALAASVKSAAHPGAMQMPSAPSVPVTPVAGGKAALPRSAGAAAPVQVLPGAGTGTIQVGGGPARVGTVPVRLGRAAGGGPAPSRVSVDVADQTTAGKAGVKGLLLRVMRADGSTDAGQVSVSVDYSTFGQAFGGNWGSSLRLVEMPGCAITTPADPTCQSQTLIPSTNDGVAHQVTAQVTLASAGTGGQPGAAATTGSGAVLALTASVSGAQGNYGATPLKPAETWSAGTQSGDFEWGYPIEVPPGMGAQAPQIGLGYSSAVMDGTTASVNSQSSLIGAGFDYAPGSVTRSYVPCSQEGVSGNLGDQCWESDNATLSLGGKTMELIKDDSTGDWHPKFDDGSKVERVTPSVAVNGAYKGQYWVVTTVDGTKYYFGLDELPGWAQGDATTNSVWTMPVYGPNSGDPCNSSSGFSVSWCNQAWEWALDLVVDPQGNAESYYYNTESNFYARDASASTGNGTPTKYTRGGYLTTIDYGGRWDNVYSHKPMKVSFNTAARCTDTADGCPQTDVPWNLNCASGSSCTGDVSPSFWTNKKLTSITTSVYESTGYVNVDTYALDNGFKDDGDGTWDMVLNGITHKGDVGGSVSVPKVTFGYVQLPNRVDVHVDNLNLPPLYRVRLASIKTESGSVISVTYSKAGCTPSTEPDPSTNTTTCFPQFWELVQPPAKPDWFNHYNVTDVVQSDNTGASVPEVYHYDYSGPGNGAGWHYAEDNGLVPTKFKTWADFRGYRKVVVTTGASGDVQTQTTNLYMQGMNGDLTASGGHTSGVQVTDSQGVSLTDDPPLAGFVRESIVLNGPGGPEVSGAIQDPKAVQTGDSARAWGSVSSNMLETQASHNRVDLASGAVRTTEVDNTYNGHGLEEMASDLGDVQNPTPRCTITTYAENAAAGMYDYPAEVQSTAQPCPTTPPTSGTLPLPTDPSLVISDERISYDNQAWGTGPVADGGNVTKVQQASSGGASPTFITTSTSNYDQYGRETSAADALGRTTGTAYNSSSSGNAVTQIVVTDPANNTSTINLDPTRGRPTSEIDVNGERTDLTYDALGRLTAEWLPGWPESSHPTMASKTYAYQVNDTVPSSVTTGTLLPSGLAYSYSYELYDGQLRERQVQVPAIGATGRVIKDTYYNSVGQLYKSTQPYYNNQGSAGTSLVAPIIDTSVPGEDVTAFDGAGRPVSDTFEEYGVAKWSGSEVYGGDRTTATPPQGGIATTSIVDARGEETQLCQYHDLAPSGKCDAANSDSTHYNYYPNGRQQQVTDPAGNTWTYAYDFLGRRVSQSDVDAGASSSTYDNAGQLTSTKDARGQVLSYVYDSLGHMTQEWSGAAGTGTQLAAWNYNATGSDKEQLASESSYQNGATYTTAINSYSPDYQPTSTTYTIPATEGALSGQYTFTAAYNASDGSTASVTYPAAGGLSAETVTYTYDGTFGTLLTTKGLTDYVEETNYDVFGKVQQLDLGTSPAALWSYDAFLYDVSTGRLSQHLVTQDASPTVQAENTTYTYDPAGNLLGAADTPTGNPAANNVECFQYGPLDRLKEAWAQGSTGCATTPSASAMGGASPYWESYTYDVAGNRTSSTQHSATGSAGDTTSNNSFPVPGQAQAHLLESQTTTGPTGTYNYAQTSDQTGDVASITAGTYDSSGHLTVTSNKALTWNPDGKLAKISDSVSNSTTTYAYDADGNQLIVRDPNSATLYLPQEELTANAAGQVTATRYYEDGGATVAARTPKALDWLIADQHGTDDLSIDASTQAVTRRYMDPFGASRTPAPSSPWPGSRGFVSGHADAATGLTNLGDREYNPQIGEFISADPLIDPSQPQALNAYAYAGNNPTTYSDPSGLTWDCAPACKHPTPPPPPPPAQQKGFWSSTWGLIIRTTFIGTSFWMFGVAFGRAMAYGADEAWVWLGPAANLWASVGNYFAVETGEVAPSRLFGTVGFQLFSNMFTTSWHNIYNTEAAGGARKLPSEFAELNRSARLWERFFGFPARSIRLQGGLWRILRYSARVIKTNVPQNDATRAAVARRAAALRAAEKAKTAEEAKADLTYGGDMETWRVWQAIIAEDDQPDKFNAGAAGDEIDLPIVGQGGCPSCRPPALGADLSEAWHGFLRGDAEFFGWVTSW